jgi:hypothetical protein
MLLERQTTTTLAARGHARCRAWHPARSLLCGCLLIAAAFSAGCGRLAERYCELRLPAVASTVTAGSFNYTVSQPDDAAALSSRSEHDVHEITMGLTTAQSRSQVEFHLRGMTIPSGVCVRPEVRLDIDYAPVQVFLARELAPGSCEYREVLAHEMRHVAVFREHLAQARERLAILLRERLPAARVYRFASMNDASVYFKSAEQTVLAEAAQADLDAVSLDQLAIDTPEEYARLSAACGDKTSGSPP